MARKTRTSTTGTTPKGPVAIDEAVGDAVEAPAPEGSETPDTKASQTDAAKADDAAATPKPKVESASTARKPRTAETPDVSAAPEPDAQAEPAPEAQSEPEQSEPDRDAGPEPETERVSPPPPPQQVTVQKVGFVPLVLGGAIAAGLGFAAAWTSLTQGSADYTAQLSAQSSQIATLEADLAALAAQAPDLAPIEARIEQAQQELSARIETVGAEIAAFEERLTGVERAPGVDGTLAETAIASWEEELDTLREEIAAQQSRMGEIATDAEAELQASREAAARVEQEAAAAAEQAIARAALARIQVALDSGTPFDAALADLTETSTEAPEALAAVAAEGVPTIGVLRESFPDAARAALAAARSEGLADVDTNPVTAFLRNQFDVRSVTPREGDDPDAVLSRVNAALNENRLTDALAEIEGLPEVARAEMSGWIAQAEARTAATAAVETLDQSMNN